MPKHLGIKSIRPGSTHRDEVLQKIGWADAGLQNKRVLLARWKVSQMAVCVGAAAQGAGAADCGRIWQAHNLLVEFDRQGIVRKVQRVRDHDIGKVLTTWLATNPRLPLHLSMPIRIGIFRRRSPAELSLAKDSLLYHYKAKSMRIPRQQIARLNTLGWRSKYYSIRAEIQYRGGHGKTRKLKFWMSPASLLTLSEYLEQTPPTPSARDSTNEAEISRGK